MIPAIVISHAELEAHIQRKLGFAFPIEWDERIEGREFNVSERSLSNKKLSAHVLGGIRISDVGIVLNSICADGAIDAGLYLVR